jgi:DHA1 family tetracycline resistance protein-like MFS transporter
VAPLLLTAALLGMAFMAMFAFHQPYALSLGAERVGSFFVGFTVAALAMRLGLGGLGDRFGHRPVAMFAILLYAMVPFSMSGLSTEVLWMYGAGLGVAHGIVYPTLTALATERAPPETRGRIIGAYSGSFQSGTTLGSLAWGHVAAGAGYPRVFHGATVAALVGLATLFLLRPRDAAA